MPQKILVFGGSGFIGTHLLQRLARDGHDLVSIDSRDPSVRLPGVEYLNADVRDLSGLDVGGEIACIFNLAAVHTTPGHPAHEYYETNITGATEVTAFARRRGVREIVFTSSISVYGPSEEKKTEQSRPAPQSAYGWSKLLAEGIHKAWLKEQSDRKLVIVRPAVIFGPHEGGNFTRLARMLRYGLFPYPGRNDTIKACFYVEDLIDAMLYARQRPERFILFNGCYPDRYTIAEVVETLRAVSFPHARTFVLPKWMLLTLARLLKPLSSAGLGIHPDRIYKLIQSTDIFPSWLVDQGYAVPGRLRLALERWKNATGGQFD